MNDVIFTIRATPYAEVSTLITVNCGPYAVQKVLIDCYPQNCDEKKFLQKSKEAVMDIFARLLQDVR